MRNKRIKNRPTIAHVVSHYPPHIGGMQIGTQEVSLELARRNWPVQVITSNAGAGDAPRIEKKGNYLVNRLKSIEFAHTPVMWGFFRKLFTLPKKSVIHLHVAQVFTPEVVWLVSKIRRIPYIAHFHLDVPPSGPLGFLFLIYKKVFLGIILRDASRVLAYSQEQADLIKRKYFVSADKIAFIPNGVAGKFFKFKQRTLPKDTLNLLFVGRLCVQKRVDRLIESLALTKTPVKLTIVGDGEKRTALEKQVERLGLNNVIFAGAKTGNELLKYYQDSDVFVLPTDIEAGIPQVLLQAMANGLPVIGSDVIGVSDFVEGCGIKASPTPEGFAEAFEQLWQNKESLNRLSRLGLAKAKNYSWRNLTKKLEPLYIKVFKENDEEINVVSGFNRVLLASSIILWGLLFAYFKIADFNRPITNILGFSFLLFAPGVLTYLMFRFPRNLSLFGKLGFIIAFSLLELISVALFNNTILPFFGVSRPLDQAPLAGGVTVLILGLLLISWRRLATWRLDFNYIKIRDFKSIDWLSILIPLPFVVMSIMGAINLNNGGSNTTTLAMLAGMAIYFFWLIAQSQKLNRDAITISLYIIGLSLLLMTSMRGWYTAGHDIQKEFLVFSLSKNRGIWDINYFRDAYNASLSITLLPTIFANLLKIQAPYVFKIFFQLIFAITPSLVYLTMQRYLKPSYAITAAIWFMAFPTYFTDMPMLNRQEIAFLFLALMLWFIFEPKLSVFRRQSLFAILGSSLAILHYSTMYSLIIILFFSIAARWSLTVLKSITERKAIFKQSSIAELSDKKRELFYTKPLLTFPILVVFILVSLGWVGVITKTNTFAGNVINKTLTNLPNLFEKNTRSGQVSNILFSGKKIDNKELLNEYINKVVKTERKQTKTDVYFNDKTIKQYPVKIAEDSIIPISKTGQIIKNQGIDVAAFNFTLRQGSAKILQIFIILGIVYLFLRRGHILNNKINTEFATFAIGSLLFVLILIILPVLSTAYGLLRAFQQSLMALSLFLVIGSLLLTIKGSQKVRIYFASLLAITFFLSSTGFITQTLGGYYPQLQLNNSGVYYDLYYLRRNEILGAQWLDNYTLKLRQNKEETAQFDPYTLNKIGSHTPLSGSYVLGYIYPALLKRNSYVFIGPQALKHRSSFSYQGNIITYYFPIELLENEKDLIYSNGDVRVYR